jgi:uncharacterized protein (TIGR02246 family)
MKPRVSAVAGALTVVLLSACDPAEPSPEATLSDTEARVIIDDMMSGWDAAVEAGEPEANASVYTDDAIRMQPDMPALVGRAAIQAWMEEQQAMYSFEGSNEILEVRALSADWILFRSEGSFVRTPRAGGEPSVVPEKWLSIAQRQPDGSWKVYRDGGSSVLPR